MRLSSVGLLVALLSTGCKGEGTEAGAEEQVAASAAESDGPTHPPEVAAAAARGHELFFGKAMCSTCHRVADEGGMIVGPNLGIGDDMSEPVSVRAQARGQASPAVYIIESILDPEAVVVPGYARGVMKSPDDIPIALSDDEFVDLVAFLLTTGATAPVEGAALDEARAHIPVARASRQQRRTPSPG